MSAYDELELSLAARASFLVSMAVLAAVATTCICIRGELTADVRLQAAVHYDRVAWSLAGCARTHDNRPP